MQLKYKIMKKAILLFITILSLGCKAQSPIFPRYNTVSQSQQNAYYKDVDNFHDQFVGTWLLNDGTNYLKVTFKNKPMFYKLSDKTYVDFLIGEYEYKLNGVTKVNSLANLDIDHTKIYNYNLVSGVVITKDFVPFCLDCGATEKRLLMSFRERPSRDPNWGPRADFAIRKVIENGVVKLKVQFIKTFGGTRIASPEVADFSLPYGDYTLIKQ